MKTYTLKLKTASTTNYSLYDGTTLVSDADLTTLFATEGEAYFAINLNSLTPTNLTSLTVVNSSNTAVMTNTGLTLVDGKNFKGAWGNSATSFTSFVQLSAYGLDESQLSALVNKISGGGGTGVEIVKKEITANILARDLFELTSADNQDYRRAYMVKNTNNDVRKIVFSNSISTDNPTEYVALSGKGELFIVLLGKGRYEGGSFIAFEPHGVRGETGVTNDPVIIGGLFGYSISNPQIRRMQIGAIDNLTTTSADDALAASQGKVLNDKIGGDLSNLTTTDKSSLINAINELNTRISNL